MLVYNYVKSFIYQSLFQNKEIEHEVTLTLGQLENLVSQFAIQAVHDKDIQDFLINQTQTTEEK